MRRLALLFFAAAMLLPFEAEAQSSDGGYWARRLVGYAQDGSPRYVRVYCRSAGYCYRPRRYASTQTRRDPTRVYSYVRRDTDDDDRGGGHCRETRRAVGDQHLTVDGAKKAANDSWAGTVRFHLGEKYMDLGNAKQIVYTCSRSSIKEGGVTTLGQSLTRCEIEATPCRPQRQMEANEK
jgi:hypothetical protein